MRMGKAAKDGTQTTYFWCNKPDAPMDGSEVTTISAITPSGKRNQIHLDYLTHLVMFGSGHQLPTKHVVSIQGKTYSRW